VFGFGNYAKTTLVPYLSRELAVRAVHEIDPCQIGPDPSGPIWDTSPEPRPDDASDCWAISTYHHLHAPLAAEALRRGKRAVVEKPLAVSEEALDEFLDVYDAPHDGAVFVCFQRRYAAYNRWIELDVRLEPEAPLDYHCLVYEEPLPARHWYRWPASGSRLTSNGCHWIDHFLFLNAYAEPVATAVSTSTSGVVNCSVELANGAFFTMVLTDHGSARIGVQDIVDVRSGCRSARIVNGSRYTAEDRHRVLRRERVRKLDAYERMYRSIGRGVAARSAGDPRASLEVPVRLTQMLERQYQPA
jgi:predicted dehydrogenase